MTGFTPVAVHRFAQIDPVTRLAAAAHSIGLAALLTLAAYAGPVFVAAVVVLLQVLLAQAPAPTNSRGRVVRAPLAMPVLVASAVATGLTLAPHFLVGADGTVAGDVGHLATGTFAPAIVAGAVAIVGTLAAQMFRRDRQALVATTAYSATLALISCLAVGWITGVQSLRGPEVVAVAAAALVAAMVTWQLPVDRWMSGILAVAAGGGGGALCALAVGGALPTSYGFVAGLGVGLFAVLGHLLGVAWAQGRRHASAGWGFPGALAVVLAGPIVHLAGQMVGLA